MATRAIFSLMIIAWTVGIFGISVYIIGSNESHWVFKRLNAELKDRDGSAVGRWLWRSPRPNNQVEPVFGWATAYSYADSSIHHWLRLFLTSHRPNRNCGISTFHLSPKPSCKCGTSINNDCFVKMWWKYRPSATFIFTYVKNKKQYRKIQQFEWKRFNDLREWEIFRCLLFKS